jgi:hypothetical protein
MIKHKKSIKRKKGSIVQPPTSAKLFYQGEDWNCQSRGRRAGHTRDSVRAHAEGGVDGSVGRLVVRLG